MPFISKRAKTVVGTTIEALSPRSFASHLPAIQSSIALQKVGRHIGIEHRLRTIDHVADRVARAAGKMRRAAP
jgi:hypothetical protein